MFQPAPSTSPSPPQPAAVMSTDLLGLEATPAPAAPTVQSIFESPTTIPGLDGFGAALAASGPAPATNGGSSMLVDVFGAPTNAGAAAAPVGNFVADPTALSPGAEEHFRKYVFMQGLLYLFHSKCWRCSNA